MRLQDERRRGSLAPSSSSAIGALTAPAGYGGDGNAGRGGDASLLEGVGKEVRSGSADGLFEDVCVCAITTPFRVCTRARGAARPVSCRCCFSSLESSCVFRQSVPWLHVHTISFLCEQQYFAAFGARRIPGDRKCCVCIVRVSIDKHQLRIV